MEVIETGLEGLLILKPTVHGDHRGYFFESYNQKRYKEFGINLTFVQDNEAMSAKNIFRGFHYQIPPYGQTKLVRVVRGSVLDIAIDIRPHSPTYGKHYAIELSAANKLQFLIPAGFAHGYLSLEDHTIFAYKVDSFYRQESEKSISYLDPALNIQWPFPLSEFVVSEKDTLAPPLNSHVPYE